MAGIDKNQIISIIEKHKNSLLYIVSKKDKGIIMQYGVMQNVSFDNITIAEAGEGGRIISIPFEKNGGENIFHVYNTQNIDLIKAKATTPLSGKLSIRENKKVIFSRLKPQLNNNLFFVYKQKMAIHVTSGQFVDMGMMGIVLKLPPFFNEEVNLPYNTVFHIYTDQFEDLLV